MRAPRGKAWDRVLERYFLAHGLPLRWDAAARRFVGLAGFDISRRSPYNEESLWQRMPEFFKRSEKDKTGEAISIVANSRYGDSVDDCLVVIRLGALAPMLKALYESDKERWSA